MRKVDVLLATYNGESYLREQLDSVLAQEGVAVRVLVRDDGSGDATRRIVEDYMARLPGQVLWVEDGHPRAGVCGNFFRLLALPSEADYFAFCDQDDVWLPQKLARAVALLDQAPRETPALYCAGYTLVDQALQAYGQNPSVLKTPGFGNALVENIAAGMTSVFNPALRTLMATTGPDPRIVMHDWWAYLLASAFGQVFYEPEPVTLYRQHGRNVEGGVAGLDSWKQRLRLFLQGRDRGKVSRQMRYFHACLGERLEPERRRVLEAVYLSGSVGAALHCLRRQEIYRMRAVDDLMVAVRILLGRL